MKSFWVTLLMLFFVFAGNSQAWAADDEVIIREITVTTYLDGSERIIDTMGDRLSIKRIRQGEVCDADEMGEVGFMLMRAYLNAQSAKFAGDMNQRIGELRLAR